MEQKRPWLSVLSEIQRLSVAIISQFADHLFAVELTVESVVGKTHKLPRG